MNLAYQHPPLHSSHELHSSYEAKREHPKAPLKEEDYTSKPGRETTAERIKKSQEARKNQTKLEKEIDLRVETKNGLYFSSPVFQKEIINQIDIQDKGTPDHWIPRHTKLIRLTGHHPLNAEPPILELIENGLITPNSLHYVRNHGIVPKLDWETHQVEICGLVEEVCYLSMEELKSMPNISIPVTIECDGNRRKELNMLKKTRGFNWGTGAISTSVWKGVPLSNLLEKINYNRDRAKFVSFEGADQLPRGNYGTSIPIEHAINPLNDVILAYEMNGELLPPDHGYPVRVVIPGFAGGRMVKWLKKIIIQEEESSNHYHYYDNRLLPSSVNDFSMADSGGWWFLPNCIIYAMNVNSVITHPPHGNTIDISTDPFETYTVKGYAYAGGGRKISRVELSLDGGQSWDLCQWTYPKDYLRHGIHCWVWCHWKIDIDMWRFLQAKEMIVRAWDSSWNTQPSSSSWNVLGMMNNSWYRVKFDVQLPPRNKPHITFNHPVLPGSHFGGWMFDKVEQRMPTFPLPSTYSRREISLQEIANHNKEEDCWIIIDGDVYDVTPYMKEHPGGIAPFMTVAGGDASEVFRTIHARDGFDIKDRFCIGSVATRDCLPSAPTARTDTTVALNPRKWITLTLEKREDITHDTRKFCFRPQDGKKIGLPVGQHVLIAADLDDHLVVRPYTPTSPVTEDEDQGMLELVIKIYFPGKSAVFPQGGALTQHLETLKVGDTIKAKGPAGHVLYHGGGHFTIHGRPIKLRKISMICGGTGITPMYQIAKAIVNNPDDPTNIKLLYGNHSVDDILLKFELDELAKDSRFTIHYTVSKQPETTNWKFSVGRIDYNMIRSYLFSPDADTAAFLCGPPALVEHTCIPSLEKFGYFDDFVIEF